MSTTESHRTARAHDARAAFDNGPRGHFNAWFFTAFDGYVNHIARRHKQHAFADISPGTIVEIGAGQEVARWFFQAGGAAGSVAKTMSAYDMTFSDEIYGPASDRRYVSRARLERMLEQEFDLILTRVRAHRPAESTFFSFANTVAAQGYRRRDECHGWLGVRLQTAPGSDPDEIILHVRMLDDTNVEQQEALGIVGVNLIYGAFFHAHEPKKLLRSLTDNLKWGRVEIDLVEFRGPVLGRLDNRLMALELVKASLARAVLFNPDGSVEIPADALYKQNVIGLRGSFKPVTDIQIAMYEDARKRFAELDGVEPDHTVGIAEMTMAELAASDAPAAAAQERASVGEIDTSDFLARVDALSKHGFHVLISEFFRHFRVRQYLARYTKQPVAFATDVDNLANILREDFYDGLDGGILEGIGKLFMEDTTVYVYPGRSGTEFADLPVADDLRPLVDYLQGRGQLVPVGKPGD